MELLPVALLKPETLFQILYLIFYADLQARENYCEEISSAPSDALTKLAADTLSHPWAEVHAQGKTKWNLDPRMVSGAHEGTIQCNYDAKFKLALLLCKLVIFIKTVNKAFTTQYQNHFRLPSTFEHVYLSFF